MSDHHAEIYRYVLRVTGRRQDADDLAQETFLRAFRAHRTLPPDANSRAWLFAIATNLTRNHFRSQKRRRLAYAAVVTETRETDEERPDRVTHLAGDRGRRGAGGLRAPAQAALGLPPAEGPRARLRGDRPEPRVLGGDGPGPRVPGSPEGSPRPRGARADREGARVVKRRRAGCVEIEADLVAAAIGEADTDAEGRVAAHVARCEPCRVEHAELPGDRPRARGDPGGARRRPGRGAVARAARGAAGRPPEPDRRLPGVRLPAGADPPGALGAGRRPAGVPSRPARISGRSRLARMRGIEAVEDGGEAEGLYRDFRAYVEGRAQRLPWALDLRLAQEPVPAEGARAHGQHPVRRRRLVQAGGERPRAAPGGARRGAGAPVESGPHRHPVPPGGREPRAF